MKISVITAVFNRSATVGQAIESVLSQTHGDIELLVQDGGSTDGTLEVLQQIEDPRLKLVSETDNGIYDALNRGIPRATGDVVGPTGSVLAFPEAAKALMIFAMLLGRLEILAVIVLLVPTFWRS